jgi:hypothetical protein
MIEDGRSLHEIAEATGHPRSSVADKLRRLNVKSLRFRRPWSEEECQVVLTLHGGGASLGAIAQALPRRSADAIQQKLQELYGPAPFRSTKRNGLPPVPMATSTSTSTAAPAATMITAANMPPLAPARGAVRLMHERERQHAKPPVIAASTDEMVRWLRSRDFMVLHQSPGWQVDHHRLEDEGALLEFVNLRRLRLSLPPFVRSCVGYME